jgi:uncharacterized protein (TIGR02266 family)
MTDRTEQLEFAAETRSKARLIIYYGPENQSLMTDFAVNMSTGGVFIETGNVLPVDTPLILEFLLPGHDNRITCRARVAWTNEPENLRKQRLPSGMGMQFLDLSLENMHAIRQFLNKGHLVPTW